MRQPRLVKAEGTVEAIDTINLDRRCEVETGNNAGRVARPERSDGRGESSEGSATPFVPQGVPPDRWSS